MLPRAIKKIRNKERRDKASGIVNDPNLQDDPAYIIALIGRVITVSLETMRIVKGLPPLDIPPS